MENIAKIKAENEALKNQINALKTIISEREAEIDLLKENIKLTRSKLFGSSSEKTPKGQIALEFFDEAEKESNPNAIEPDINRVVKKKRKSRTDNLNHLETEITEYDLDEGKKTCPNCNSKLVKSFEETRETIKLYKRVIRNLEKRAVYSCPKCNYMIKAPMSKLPIEGSLASSSALAQVIVDKYANGIPLYRQSQDFDRIGLSISRQTLSNWIMISSDLLDIVYKAMVKTLLTKDILHADETTLQVLKESGKATKTKSYMWLYRTGRYSKNQILIYDYQPTRGGDNPKRFLSDFKGYLHVDGYAGYNQVEGITLVGCLAHVRRYFNDAYKLIEKQDDSKESLTYKGLSYCNQLFSLDRESKELSLDERFKFKQEKIKPMFKAFLTWVNNALNEVLPKSKLGSALTYASNQLGNVMHYLDKAELDIDNNLAERSIKPFVIGRKNWLFSNTVNGADASARLYSIVQTCIMNKINPYLYLDITLTKLANMTINRDTDLDELMPWNFKMNSD